MKCLSIIAIFILSAVALVSSEDNTTTTFEPTTTTVDITTTEEPITTILNTTTVTDAPTTTTTTTTTETSTSDTNTTTTEDNTTTTEEPPVTTTTTGTPVTTTTLTPDTVLNFTVINANSTTVCLKMVISLNMNLSYIADKGKNGTENSSILIGLDNYNSYEGECTDSFNSLKINFREKWSLVFNYTLNKEDYKLSELSLSYVVDEATFPNVVESELGPRTAMLNNLTEFSALKGNSYKCISKSEIILDNKATVDITNYQAQPFINKENNKEKPIQFDTAVDCPNDLDSTSKLVPIIVGSTLAVLVVLVLIFYIIGRRKHRPGYQTV